MPSPFPGMDPYIESSGYWGEFHGSMIVEMRNELNARLPKGYIASTDQYVWVHKPEASERGSLFEPDVYVSDKTRGKGRGPVRTAVLDPETLTLSSVQRRKQKYVRIVDLDSNRLVTVIELLSPSNKEADEDGELYRAKRSEHLANRLCLVEIDLLRAGRRLPLSQPPPEVEDYYVMVSRSWQFPEVGFYRFSLQDPLPEVPIPLTRELTDVKLPLRPCMDRVYDGARFDEKLHYDRPLTPRPRKPDAAWIRQLLAAREEK